MMIDMTKLQITVHVSSHALFGLTATNNSFALLYMNSAQILGLKLYIQ